jgi:hypothetical protein
MKAFLFIILGIIGLASKSQVYRYFEFSSSYCNTGWQDTSFIAATSDQNVIDTFLAELNKPLHQRKFIAGPITYGNGGHNHNASHWFLWSFIPDKWTLTDIATEYCDGCPMFVDADTALWVGHIGFFCPNSANPSREVSEPIGFTTIKKPDDFTIYPNPFENVIFIKKNTHLRSPVSLKIYDPLGKLVYEEPVDYSSEGVNLAFLNDGLYFLCVSSDLISATSRIIKKSRP